MIKGQDVPKFKLSNCAGIHSCVLTSPSSSLSKKDLYSFCCKPTKWRFQLNCGDKEQSSDV